MIYKFNVTDDSISSDTINTAVSGSMGIYRCEFSFSGIWGNLTKFALFRQGDKEYSQPIENGSCLIPAEIASVPCTVSLGVYGSNMNSTEPVRITTDFAHIIIKEGAYSESAAPSVPQADLWEVYFERAALEAQQAAIVSGTEAAKAAKAEFDNTLGDINNALDALIENQEAILEIQNYITGGDNI